ncbi:MAG: S8 family serine peptidase [candidate division Zixibacteria bacterium]|nr:S8 family serine peptidase [candidate division Zixibacteria bacterium]
MGTLGEASVWDFAGLSDTVVVAVIDDGITEHWDLPLDRILPGRDFNTGDTSHLTDDDPSPGYEEGHGMGCAGIVAASHSTDPNDSTDFHTGVMSMNPAVKVLPVKIFADTDTSSTLTYSLLADAISWAYLNGADVLSNSWGWEDSTVYGTEEITAAIYNAFMYGRGGMGCPVVFSSGNWSHPWVSYPASLSYSLAVGALTLADTAFDYSQYGEHLDLMAPSGKHLTDDVWTLDQRFAAGENPNYIGSHKDPIIWDCTLLEGINDDNINCHFGGTSAACPVVSGAASLLLARDSTLSSQVIYEILKHTAVRLWEDTTMERDFNYGYGRVDAFRALLSISRGDADNNDVIDVGDLTTIIDYLFNTFEPPFPDPLLADCDCSGSVDVGDVSAMIDHLFILFADFPYPCFEFGN